MHLPPADGDTWIALFDDELPSAAATRWAVTPATGAIVTFTGTVRDHSDGRTGVEELTYEAYEEHALARMAAVVADARRRWPEVRRVAVLHRVGSLAVGDEAVVVAVSSPHRADAFAAAEHVIDVVKATVPIWKRERWAGGEGWGTCAHDLVDVEAAR